MNKLRMICILRQALKDNESALLMERRSVRQIELLAARTEILKSIVHYQDLLLQDMNRNEEAA